MDGFTPAFPHSFSNHRFPGTVRFGWRRLRRHTDGIPPFGRSGDGLACCPFRSRLSSPLPHKSLPALFLPLGRVNRRVVGKPSGCRFLVRAFSASGIAMGTGVLCPNHRLVGALSMGVLPGLKRGSGPTSGRTMLHSLTSDIIRLRLDHRLAGRRRRLPGWSAVFRRRHIRAGLPCFDLHRLPTDGRGSLLR